MTDGKLLQRIVVWPTYEDAAAAEEDAASADCKRSNKLTVWQTYEQAAAHTTIGAGGGGGETNAELREDGGNELREDGSIELREAA